MLGGILGRGFSSKCKSLIKTTRMRIDVLRGKKEATQRYLKSNLAQLLANGFDINAFERTEEYIAGLNLLSCYDFIEQSCVYVLKQLSAMEKQSECPDECREVVGSLMFAAARFSDFPELRDLRDTFQERYGSSLEHFVNQEFVENLASRPPTMEKKIKLLHDIALEFSIKWDSRGFKIRMANPSASPQGQPKKYGPIHDHDKGKTPKDTETVTKTDKRSHSSKERNELATDKNRVEKDGLVNLLKRVDLDHHYFRREELTGKNQNPSTGSEQSTLKRDNYDITPQPRREFPQHDHELWSSNGKDSSSGKGVGKRTEFVNRRYEGHNDSLNSVNHYGQLHTASTTGKVQEEERDRLKPYSSTVPPPPYIKSRDKLVPPPYIKSLDGKHGVDTEASMVPSTHRRENVVRASERIQGESNRPKYEKNLPYQNDIPIPRPRSTRRKHSEPYSSSSRDEVGYSEVNGGVKGSSSSRRRDSSKGLQILIDDEHHRKDEDERAIDNLLLHYSTKTSTYLQEKVSRKSKKASDGLEYAMGPPPTRCASLPREQIAPAEASVKVYTRANSFQPDKPAAHVHPKLPDYDDLAAQLAALRGR